MAAATTTPMTNKATGFDAIFENPQFAGADTSYWIRQSVPLVGGGRVALSTRNGILNNLRSSKEQGQSNFTNPGILLAGIGADMDLTPQLRWSFNLNSLWFAETAVLEAARNQAPISDEIRLRPVHVNHLPPADVAEHRAASFLRAPRASGRLC